MPEIPATFSPPDISGRLSVARVPNAWYVGCRSDELCDAPLARTMLGTPVVLYRDAEGRAAALLDRCPHRNVPLSLGAVDEAGRLACAYHGWRFDHTGACRDVPGLLGAGEAEARARAVRAFATIEQDGFVWVWPDDTQPVGVPAPIPHAEDDDYIVVVREFDVECSLHAALENALDVPHTAFVHRGDFRGKGTSEIEAVRRRIPGGIEVEYIGEAPLAGSAEDEDGNPIVSEHWDRFFMPSIAQVEYRTGPGRHLITTLPHTPVSDLRTRFWLVSCWNMPGDPESLRPAVEKQLDTILGQDVEILRAQTRSIQRFGGEVYRSTALDLMGPEILRMLKQGAAGLPADEADIARRVRMQVF